MVVSPPLLLVLLVLLGGGAGVRAAPTSTPQQVATAQADGAPGKWPLVTPLPDGKRRVCTFDFDDTLKLEGDTVPADASFSVNFCVARISRLPAQTTRAHKGSYPGAGARLPRGGCHRRLQGGLRAPVPAAPRRARRHEMFTDRFFQTPAFQACQPYKTASLTAIKNYFGLQSAARCVALVDNTSFNGIYANATGSTFQWVDNGALDLKVGETGVKASDMYSLERKFDASCPMQPVARSFAGGWEDPGN